MARRFEELASNSLVFLPEHGMGYYPVSDAPYDADYFDKYKSYEDTDIGKELNAARIELVNKYTDGEVLDVGIGCGSFVSGRGGETYGADINPKGIAWLEERGLLRLLEEGAESATFWDSLEHIHEADAMIEGIRDYVFVSLPIFRDADHILKSKHFRKDEHCWYWTHTGFISWMSSHGFRLVEHTIMEKRLGREDIDTYVFQRR